MRSNRLVWFTVVLFFALSISGVASTTAYFTDIFSSDELAALWYWEREDPSAWSLAANPGHLRIYTQQGTLWGDYSLPRNTLLTQISADSDFQVEVRLTFQPQENFHEAGVVVYRDPSNYILLGRAFCDYQAGGCVGDGVYVDHEESGVMLDDPSPIPWEGDHVYLRIHKKGTTHTFFASKDGESWTQMGTQYGVGVQPTAVGLYAYSEYDVDSIPADFDYFRITPLP
jgi:beta-xylosidase